jgi:UDP-N-acetyl-D-glucosamine dehydrogenase
MIHSAGHINMRMPHYMYIKIATALNRNKKAVRERSILFIGVAYKPNIDDARESPALAIMDKVVHKGGALIYHNPITPQVRTNEGGEFDSVDLSAETLTKADCVVLTTNHKNLEMEFIQTHSEIIVDMRNMIKEGSNRVVKL